MIEEQQKEIDIQAHSGSARPSWCRPTENMELCD